MARRKSLLAQMYAEHQKAKRERERAEERSRKAWEAEERRVTARLAKEAQQAERERLQAKEKAERLAAQQERERERQAAAQVRERQRQQVEAQREEKRRYAEERQRALRQRMAEAEFRTEAINRQITAYERLIRDRNRSLAAESRRIGEIFNAHGSAEFVAAVQQALAISTYPDGLHGSCAAMFRPEARELLVEYELPRQAAVPAVAAYRYVQTKEAVQAEPRKDAEIKRLYGQLIARVALRTLAEAFDATPVTLVSNIVFNGYVSAKDRTTGKSIRPLLISTHATRDKFCEIVLDEPELDPEACLRAYLNAVVSPHPYDLEAVRPVVQFDLSKYKFVEEMDVVAGMDSRMDLLALKPVEFEHLIRQLFEAIGMRSWVTQASRDEGVDGVATNEDPIVGGLCIIQAKRYSKIVGLEAVHALAGVMEDKNAAKGVLVTTSWVGKASRDFAARNGRIEIIEGRHLKSLLLEHLGKDVLISLPNLPPGWERGDVS
jgi:restriction system protein